MQPSTVKREWTVRFSWSCPEERVRSWDVAAIFGDRGRMQSMVREVHLGKWLIHCHIPQHPENDNVEEHGGGLMMVIDVA
jgi:Multicopper oxidase